MRFSGRCGTRGMVLMLHRTAPPLSEWLPLGPDVVLLDMETPLMDGCQVAKHLRSDYLSEDCLIIAFAEWVDDASRKPCLEAGIDLLLSKPVDRDVVETLLMLECVRVNRRRARGLTPPDVHGPSPHLHSE